MEVECEGFTFTSKFDGGNLAQVEYVPKTKSGSSGKGVTAPIEQPDYEFNLWTKLDCGGTEFENGNRTWFYFGIKGGAPFALVKLNIVNLNRQAKLFSEGMSPVYRIIPGRPNWERIHDKPIFAMEQKRFVLTFKYRTLENLKATTYFAFTYPYSYSDLQSSLRTLDTKCECLKKQYEENKDPNTIYYRRECLCFSLEQRRMDLLTVTSHHGITSETEPRLRHLFPEINTPRSHKFADKKIVFVSARVHPGETPSSFVLNGMLNYVLQPNDPVAQLLRKHFVFKFIPSLNPDGMSRGHYRTDTRGVNLNRVYLNPSLILHPTIYAAQALIRYHHYGCELPEEEASWESIQGETTPESPCSEEAAPILDIKSKVSVMSLVDSESSSSSADGSANAQTSTPPETLVQPPELGEASGASAAEPSVGLVEESVTGAESSASVPADETLCQPAELQAEDKKEISEISPPVSVTEPLESGIFMYLDLHGHASKKGVFMYGNHFDNIEDSIECMLLPKIVSLNSTNFHFTSCNFTKRNMYLRDRRDGMSREGSGRVAVYKMTGLVRSYTLECNYNTGRLVNSLPPSSKDAASKPNTAPVIPPKYTPQIFEEVGRAVAVSVLDLAGLNPWSRVRTSDYRNLQGVREWLRRYVQMEHPRPSPQQRRASAQVTSAGSTSSALAGPSTLPSAVEGASSSSAGATRPRLKTHHLTPLTKARPTDTPEDSEKKENLASSSHLLEPSAKLKNPMSPRENLAALPSPRFSKTANKSAPLLTNKTVQKPECSTSKALSAVTANGRVNKVRKVPDKTLNKQLLSGASSGDSDLKKFNRSSSEENKGETSSKGVQILKQGPKRLKISAFKPDNFTVNNERRLVDDENLSLPSDSNVTTTGKKSLKIQLPTCKAEEVKGWSLPDGKPTWRASAASEGSKSGARKVATQASTSASPSSPLDTQSFRVLSGPDLSASSSGGKYVRPNRSSQLRATHLSPIKSSIKINGPRKKSGSDWEKKRGKSSLKTLPIHKNKNIFHCDDHTVDNFYRPKQKFKSE